eukprot:jgi/Mesen1/5613/ME000282S04763
MRLDAAALLIPLGTHHDLRHGAAPPPHPPTEQPPPPRQPHSESPPLEPLPSPCQPSRLRFDACGDGEGEGEEEEECVFLLEEDRRRAAWPAGRGGEDKEGERQIKMGHVAQQCQCAGDFRCTETPQQSRQRLQVFLNIARYHGFQLLEEAVEWLLEIPRAPLLS